VVTKMNSFITKMGTVVFSEILTTGLTTRYYITGVANLNVFICYKIINNLFSHLRARSPGKSLWKPQTHSVYLKKNSSIYLLDINFIIMCLNSQHPYMAVSLILIESSFL
jgi:hypothetical protein